VSLCSLIKFGRIVSGSLKKEVFIWKIFEDLTYSFKRFPFDKAKIIYLHASFDHSLFWAFDKNANTIGQFDTQKEDLINVFNEFESLHGPSPFVATKNASTIFGVQKGKKNKLKVLNTDSEECHLFDLKEDKVQSIGINNKNDKLIVPTINSKILILNCKNPENINLMKTIYCPNSINISSFTGNGKKLIVCWNDGSLKVWSDYCENINLESELSVGQYRFFLLSFQSYTLFMGGKNNKIGLANFHKILEHWKENYKKVEKIKEVETTKESLNTEKPNKSFNDKNKISLENEIKNIKKQILLKEKEIKKLKENNLQKEQEKQNTINKSNMIIEKLSNDEVEIINGLKEINKRLYEKIEHNETLKGRLIEKKNSLWSQEVNENYKLIKKYEEKKNKKKKENKLLKTKLVEIKEEKDTLIFNTKKMKKKNKSLKKEN
jgi:WD40 repeat protein